MAVISLFGCGVDPDGSGVFGFSGSWQLTPRTGLVAEDCLVEFNDSQGRARCDGEQVIFEFEGERLGEEITLEADLTITETVISGSGTWTRVDTYTFNGESESRRCTLTWSGTANRDAGRQSEGRFSALAGEWSGTARYSAECGGQQAGPDVDFRFTGDLFGDSAEIRWRELASEFEHLVGVQHRDGVGVSIDGIEVPEL
jgi:hypothetical protein